MDDDPLPSEISAEPTKPALGSMTGLTSAGVSDLRKQFGFNDIPEDKKPPLLKFLSDFRGLT